MTVTKDNIASTISDKMEVSFRFAQEIAQTVLDTYRVLATTEAKFETLTLYRCTADHLRGVLEERYAMGQEVVSIQQSLPSRGAMEAAVHHKYFIVFKIG